MTLRLLLVETTQYRPDTPLFLEAARALGIACDLVDEAVHLAASRSRAAAHRVLRLPAAGSASLNRALVRAATRSRPDVVLVVKGAHLRPQALREVRRLTKARLVNFATDDPFNPRNSTPWLRAGIPEYDLYASTKTAVVPDLESAGARATAFVPFGYKPDLHFTEAPSTEAERAKFESDVVFVGGADEDRVPYVRALAAMPGLRLRLYGGYWDRWPDLRRFHAGIARGREYRLALGGARVALGMVRRANRDGHAMRSFEIPACGAFMLAEDTAEHRMWFREGLDVEYFRTPGDLVAAVARLLGDDARRRRMAEQGQRAVVGGAHTYADRLRTLLGLAEKGT